MMHLHVTNMQHFLPYCQTESEAFENASLAFFPPPFLPLFPFFPLWRGWSFLGRQQIRCKHLSASGPTFPPPLPPPFLRHPLFLPLFLPYFLSILPEIRSALRLEQLLEERENSEWTENIKLAGKTGLILSRMTENHSHLGSQAAAAEKGGTVPKISYIPPLLLLLL